MSPRTALVGPLSACLLCASFAPLLAPSPALADELTATRDQPLDEISHTVDVRIADGVATYVVQRQFRNRGKLAEEARLAIDLPSGAAATGLRIRANHVWHAGELLESRVAAERYTELTGAGVYDPKDPALLYWVSPRELALQVFPVMPGAVSTVEYTLTVPTHYAAGRYWLTYPRVVAQPWQPWQPRPPRKLVDPVLTVHAPTSTATTAAATAATAADIIIDHKLVAAGRPIALAPGTAAPEALPELKPVRAISVLDVPARPGTDRLQTKLTLDVDVRHGDPSQLELELVTPGGERIERSAAELAVRGGGTFELELDAPARAAGRWQLAAWAVGSDDIGTLGRWSISLGGQTFASTGPAVFIPRSSDATAAAATIGVPVPAIPAWTGRLGRVVASRAHAFTRLEVDAAPQLSALPKQAQVVFVLDASYSAGPERLAAQLALVRAYLAHVPDAELEVIAVRRTAARVFGRFVPARDAARLLDDAVRRGALALGNGSALDDGARLAAAILTGRTGPQRVVLATDELLRSALTGEAALASLARLAPAAVVHVVVPETGIARPELVRDDAAPLAPLAADHHGMFVRASGFPASPQALAAAALELVRPTRIDGLAATANLTVASTLHEGEGIRIFDDARDAASAPSRVTLTGRLWSDPIELDVAAGGAFSIATAGFVFGEGKHEHLEATELEIVAQLGRAVSPVTSYLAIEPGVRPSKIGLDGVEGGRAGWGVIGSDVYGGLGYGSGTGGVRPDLAALIPTEACVRRYRPAGAWAVKLVVETTRDEIVDVTVRAGAGPLASCLLDAAWAVRLDDRFDRDRESFLVELRER